MKIVIDIHEAIYEDAINHIPTGLSPYIDEVIRNGTPLPKGHGDLIDRDVARAEFDDRCFSYEGKLLKYIPTVIPADKK